MIKVVYTSLAKDIVRVNLDDGDVFGPFEGPRELFFSPDSEQLEGVEIAEHVEPEAVTVVAKIDFYERMTESEAEQVEAVIGQQSVKQRRIFESANNFRSDHELWALLNSLATGLFGAKRAGEILAPSA